MSSNSCVFKAFFLIMCRYVFACGHIHVSIGAQRGPRHQSPAAKFSCVCICVCVVCMWWAYVFVYVHTCQDLRLMYRIILRFSYTLFVEAGSLN